MAGRKMPPFLLSVRRRNDATAQARESIVARDDQMIG